MEQVDYGLVRDMDGQTVYNKFSFGYMEIWCCGVPRDLNRGLEIKLIAKYRYEYGELGKDKQRREGSKISRISNDWQDIIEHWIKKSNEDRKGIKERKIILDNSRRNAGWLNELERRLESKKENLN